MCSCSQWVSQESGSGSIQPPGYDREDWEADTGSSEMLRVPTSVRAQMYFPPNQKQQQENDEEEAIMSILSQLICDDTEGSEDCNFEDGI